jgi:limonene-1,2-epoxide hydrolase
MTSTPDELVTEFCKLWATPDVEKLVSYFAEDAVYHNMPLEPLNGRAAIKEFLLGFANNYDGIEFVVHHQMSSGNVVVNERTDVFHRKDGGQARLPVMGIFEIVDGKIAGWRDYFDQLSLNKAFS